MCSENVVSLIAKLPTLLGIYSLCPWKLSWCPIKYGFKKMRLIWTEFGLRPWIQWYNVGGNSFLCDYYILYHWSYAFFFFLTNLYFVRCILRTAGEKCFHNEWVLAGTWPEYRYLRRKNLLWYTAFMNLILPSHLCMCWSSLVWDIEWKLWVIKNENSFLHLLDMFMK